MRVSYASLALVAILSVAACSTESSDIVAPGNDSARAAETGARGLGSSGTGNAIATDSTVTVQGGIGMIGSGNAFEPDPAPINSTERGGIGMIGSGN